MNKVYLDVSGLENGLCIFVEDKEIIPAGTTVYYLSLSEKNENYQQYAYEYSVRNGCNPFYWRFYWRCSL